MRGRWPGETRAVGVERVCVGKTTTNWKPEGLTETRSQGAHRRLNGRCRPLALAGVAVADVVILRDLSVEGAQLCQSEEGEAVAVIRCGDQDRWEVWGDRCREVGQKVVDRECGALAVSTFLSTTSTSFLLQVGN
jgi:hypothetical protein